VAKQAQTTNLAFATDLIQRWTDQLPKPEPVP
jgi:hypothetical protein